MFENNYVLFDIGANWGDDSLNRCANDPNMRVWAFEPTPQLINHLTNASSGFKDRYTVVPTALADFDGEADFFIEGGPSMGANSLNTFNRKSVAECWGNNWAFSAIGSLKVPVTRLETWLKNNLQDLDHIDYFHCDTQGSDLKVLQGMGDYIRLIRAGKVECARDDHAKLYNESTNFVKDTCDFLESKGFTIVKVENNDQLGNELNVNFERR